LRKLHNKGIQNVFLPSNAIWDNNIKEITRLGQPENKKCENKVWLKYLKDTDGLTLILLTSTKWWAPASASKWRMGFNSEFKGLRDVEEARRITSKRIRNSALEYGLSLSGAW
jgi:ribosomal protein S17E